MKLSDWRIRVAHRIAPPEKPWRWHWWGMISPRQTVTEHVWTNFGTGTIQALLDPRQGFGICNTLSWISWWLWSMLPWIIFVCGWGKSLSKSNRQLWDKRARIHDWLWEGNKWRWYLWCLNECSIRGRQVQVVFNFQDIRQITSYLQFGAHFEAAKM